MKRLTYVLLVICLVCSVISCEKNKSDETNWNPITSSDSSEAEQTDSTEQDESTEKEDTATSRESDTDFWSKAY